MKTHRLFAALLSAAVVAPAYAYDLSLEQVLSLAREKNPRVIAARHSWQVAEKQIGPAGTWPNPTFTYIDEKFPGGMDGTPGQSVHHLRVEQMVPFPGKPTSESQMKRHEALIAEAGYRSKLIDILGETRMRYYQLYLTDQKIALAGETVSALHAVLRTAQSRLAAGQSSTSDVFMAQMELRRLENMLYEQKQTRTLVEAELNVLLDQPTETAWGTAEAPQVADLPATLPEFLSLAEKNSPDYWSATHETNHAKAMLRRDRLEFAPDFNLMVERETAPAGDAGHQIGVGLVFPLWINRPWSLYAGAKEHLAETEALSEDVRAHVMKSVHAEYIQVVTHLTMTRNYEKDILPTAESNLKIAREQYASGRGDFLRVLEAFRTWIDTHNEYQEQLYQYGEHLSLLERSVGIELSKTGEMLQQLRAGPEENSHAH
jgi:cobalt-zinc-cadmium efflux system outer membrane protein